MSRKKTQPKKNVVPDPKFKSTIIPKLINNIMYDGKRGIAAKICLLYTSPSPRDATLSRMPSSA